MGAISAGSVDGLGSALLKATLADFQAAADRIRSDRIHSPLLPFSKDESREVRLKAECLQPYGSFKIRAAANVLSARPAAALAGGVATASAGNFAQGLCYAARSRGVRVTVHVPDTAPQVKLRAIESLGARIVSHPFDDWWRIMSTRDTGADDGMFIHPVCETEVAIGNGTIGLELAEDWPDLDTVVVPIGGGGLAVGIALALRALGKSIRFVACEIETAAALSAAFEAGGPVSIERTPSFVDGIGSTRVLDPMWPLLRELISDVVVVSIAEARAALRTLALQNHVLVEGAGAVALAAAMSSRCGGRKVAAILSGGNIDPRPLCEILCDPPHQVEARA